MLRAARIALSVSLPLHASGALAQEPHEYAPVATVMIEALAPAGYGDWAYRWDAVSVRVSRHMHWHLSDPDQRGRAEDAPVERNGWIDTAGELVGVTAHGGDAGVEYLSFELTGYGSDEDADAVLDALRGAGAGLETIAQSEDGARYRLHVTGRDTAELTRQRFCGSPHSAVILPCSVGFSLILPARDAP